MSKNEKLYAERDIMKLDEAGNYYCKHVSAMTGEKLHSKSDIAAELAHRDYEIDKLKAQVKRLKVNLQNEERVCEQALDQRDSYHDFADQLANDIARFFGVDIGEHSSANNPWREALNCIPVQCLAEVRAQAVDALKFPTMLRKMWSGSEVQAWIKEEAKLIRQAAKG